jgi:hypothetical protein
MWSSDGKRAAMTCGIVSPIIMQKATMPPNALEYPDQCLGLL